MAAATIDPTSIEAWWTREPNDNIGIQTGLASNVVVVDVDGPRGEQALIEFGDLPRTVSAVTGRDGGGRHLYFAHPGPEIRNSASKLGPNIDVRGDGGYVIAPPSRHPTGRVYQWAPGLSFAEVALAPFPAAMMLRLAPLASGNVRRHADPALQRPDIDRLLIRTHGTPRIAAHRADGRVRGYLARVGARGAGSRNAAAFQIAAWLVNDFGLSHRIAAAYLGEWNLGNNPPLADGELRDVLASAIRNGVRPIGLAHRHNARGGST